MKEIADFVLFKVYNAVIYFMKSIFIDESGGLGGKDRYFVIASIQPNNPKRIRNFIRRFSAKNNLNEIKGSRLSIPEKQFILNKLRATKDHSISYIVVDKKNVDSPNLLQDKNLYFNYLISFLLESEIRGCPEDVTVHIDNRTIKVKSLNSLADYIRIKAYTEWNFAHKINIYYPDSHNSKIIQIIDVAANAIWARYNYDVSHLYNCLLIKKSIKFPYNEFGK